MRAWLATLRIALIAALLTADLYFLIVYWLPLGSHVDWSWTGPVNG